MKYCVTCQKTKELDQFHKRSPTGHQHKCKECNIKARINYYKKNKDKERLYDKKRIEQTSKFLFEYLSRHPCVDCSETDPVVLEFDHVRGKKHMNVSEMRGYGIKTILKEIAKCEVRCANCHRRKTAKQFNWKSAM